VSPPGIEPGLPQPQCGVIATIRRRQDMIMQKKEILIITILKKLFSYYTYFYVYGYLIAVECEEYYINSNIRIISKTYIYVSWL
jgi:hypothetical protein